MLTYGQLREFRRRPDRRPRAARRIALEARAERGASSAAASGGLGEKAGVGRRHHCLRPTRRRTLPRLPQSLPGVAASSNLGVAAVAA